MPLHLILSTSTERLIDDLAQSLAKPGDAAARRPVLLPSRPLVERVRYALAQRAGVAMGVDFLLPAAFLARLSEAVGLPALDAAWSPEGLFWRILPLIEAKASHPRLKAACADPRARLALARQVADRFDQYLHFRPQMIRAWDEGHAWADLPLDAKIDESWQRELWDDLKRAAAGTPHPVERLEQLKERARSVPAGQLGPAVEVLSTGPLPQSLLDVLAAFGRSANHVRLRQLLPSVEYLADIETKKAIRLRGLEPDDDYQVHDLLAQMGRQAIETFRGLEQLEDSGQAYEYGQALAEPEAPTLLAALQSDIRAARQPLHGRRLAETPDSLASLRVHRCHGARREVEVLRDELLRALKDDPSLRPEDILVLVPDLEAYGPLCRAYLPQSAPFLPLRLAEESLDAQDPAFQAIKALLAFAAGRATLSEGLSLIELPAAAARLGEEAQAALLERLDAAGITFGLDGAHRLSLEAGMSAVGTWSLGLDRLLAGLWMGPAGAAVDANAAPLLPVAGALSSGRQGLVDGLAWMQGLVQAALAWQAPATPAQWSQRLRAARRQLFKDPEGSEDEALEDLLAALEQAETAHGCTLALDAARLMDWLDWQGLDESRKVRPVGGFIGLGGFKPLRALPCKVLAVLGLSDGAFPRRSEGLAWDLLAAKRQSGDRDARLEDRQLFLDALLAAGSRVILTAPARNPRSDKDEPFSDCVDELLRALLDTVPAAERAGWEAALLVKHSLQPFDRANYVDGLGSFDRAQLALAETLQAPRQEPAFATAEGAPPVEGWVELEALLRFLKDPAEAWLRSLDIRGPQDAEDPAALDDEPADLADNLLRWKLRRRGLDLGLSGDAPFEVERLQADRLLPYGPLGAQAAQTLLDEPQRAAAELAGREGGGLQPLRVEVQVAGTVVAGVLTEGADKQRLVLMNPSKLDRPAVLLQAYAHAALAAAGLRPMAMDLLVRDGEAFVTKALPAVEAEAGRAWLQAVLGLRAQRQGHPPCFAPATSLALAKAQAEADKKERPLKLDDAFDKAHKQWDEESDFNEAEGLSPAALLAWRGRGALDEDLWNAWLEAANAIWGPVLAWSDAKAGGAA